MLDPSPIGWRDPLELAHKPVKVGINLGEADAPGLLEAGHAPRRFLCEQGPKEINRLVQMLEGGLHRLREGDEVGPAVREGVVLQVDAPALPAEGQQARLAQTELADRLPWVVVALEGTAHLKITVNSPYAFGSGLASSWRPCGSTAARSHGSPPGGRLLWPAAR